MDVAVYPASNEIDAQRAIDLLNEQAALWRGTTTIERNRIPGTLFDHISVATDMAQVEFEPTVALRTQWGVLAQQ